MTADYVGLGKCTRDPPWVMMNSPSLQKKKEPETKSQSHINECLNDDNKNFHERKRRETERYLYEELLDALYKSNCSIDDMKSQSPTNNNDKKVILRQTVEHIKYISQVVDSSQAIQQGEVTSSEKFLQEEGKEKEPKELDLQLILQALDGFILSVVIENRKIAYASDNVQQYLNITADELVDNDLYNYIHVGDITNFGHWMSCVENSDISKKEVPKKYTSICRFLQNPPGIKGKSMDQYESMHMSAVVQHNKYSLNHPEESGETGRQVLLYVTRPNVVPEQQDSTVEQFSVRLDLHAIIQQIDTSGLSQQFSKIFIKDYSNRPYTDLCQQDDLSKVSAALQDAIRQEHANIRCGPYKIRIGSHVLRVRTVFKRFSDCINAVHTFENERSEDVHSSTPTPVVSESLLEDMLDPGISPVPRSVDDDIKSDATSKDKESGDGDAQCNKILKSLLNQRDEEENLSRSEVHPTQHPKSLAQMNHYTDANSNNTNANNNMLRSLLKDESKKIKTEIVMSPTNCGPPTMCSSSLPSSTAPFSMPATSPSLPISRSASADFEERKGVKRSSESMYDETVKQPVGGFASLLVPSPPNVKSPVTTPGYTTPTSSPPTTSRSNTPVGRTTPNRSTTPSGRNTPKSIMVRSNSSYMQGINEDHVTMHQSQQMVNQMGMSQGMGMNHHAQMGMNQGIRLSQGQMEMVHMKAHQSDDTKTNKLLRELLSSNSNKNLPPLDIMPSPYALPSEKLPKDICDKVSRVPNAPAPLTTEQTNSNILNSILSRPNTNKNNPSGNSFHPRPNYLMGENRMQQRPTVHHPSPMNQSTDINMMSDNNITPTTSTALPPFVPPPGIHPLGSMPNYSDGQLPSITTASTAFPNEPKELHDMVIEAILDMEQNNNTDTGIESFFPEYQPEPEDETEKIKLIQSKLISELENQSTTANSTSTPMTTYPTSSSMPSVNNYPPAYAQRSRYHGQVQNNISMNPSNSMQMRNVQQSVHQQSLQQQQQMPLQHDLKARMRHPSHPMRQQSHQGQVVMASSSDVAQASSSGYSPTLDELISSPVMHRSTSESQNCANYGLMNSPMASTPDQVSPGGQRIAQPNFSPRGGQIPSPLNNNQQYAGMSPMGYQSNQNAQLSPRLSQGSPAPSNYSGGPVMPQVSPTGNPPQQSPAAWSAGNQQRAQMQGSMMGAQMNQMMGGNVRGYGGSVRPSSMLPSMPLPSSGSRPYQGSDYMMYPQQAGQQYRIQRTVSAPQMQSVHSARSAPYSLHPGHQPQPHPHLNNAPHLVGGPYPSMMSHSIMGPMETAGHHPMMPMGGVGAFGDSYEAGSSSNCFAENSRGSPGHSGMVSNRTRNQLLARVSVQGPGVSDGPSSPSVSQQQLQRPQQPARQTSATFQGSSIEHSLDQTLLPSTTDGTSWGREVQSGVPQSGNVGMSSSTRMDETRSIDNTGQPITDTSMLKKLLEE